MSDSQDGSEQVAGGCLCGAVRYTFEGPAAASVHCYCRDCRRTSGSTRCSHIAVPAETAEITGETSQFDKPADSGNMVTRHFCPTCGSQVYSTNSAFGGMVVFRASTLDDPDVFAAEMVVYGSRVPKWDRAPEGLPTFAEMPTGM